MNGAIDQEKPGQENSEHDIVQSHAVREVDHAEQLAARHALQAVFAAEKFHLEQHEVQHLRECQRDHRKIDASAANRETAENPAEQPRKRGAGDDADFRRHAPFPD